MDSYNLGGPLRTDRIIRGTPFAADTFQEKICVVRCIHAQDGKAWISMSKKTHTNPLSRREVEALRRKPYVAAVSSTTVKFTEEFKQIIDSMPGCWIVSQIKSKLLTCGGLRFSDGETDREYDSLG